MNSSTSDFTAAVSVSFAMPTATSRNSTPMDLPHLLTQEKKGLLGIHGHGTQNCSEIQSLDKKSFQQGEEEKVSGDRTILIARSKMHPKKLSNQFVS